MTLLADIIVAADQNLGIGYQGQLPWHLAGDLQYFKKITTTAAPGKINAVIMGRKTWDSLPAKVRPLPNRHNFILSRQGGIEASAQVQIFTNVDDVLAQAHQQQTQGFLDQVFVIGGASIYQSFLTKDCCRFIYLTKLQKTFVCDTFFPKFDDNFQLVSESPLERDGDLMYSFCCFKRKKAHV